MDFPNTRARARVRDLQRQQTMGDGWRAFSEVYLLNTDRINRRREVRRRFARTIKQVIIARRAAMRLLMFMHPPGWYSWNVIHRKFAKMWGVGTDNALCDPDP